MIRLKMKIILGAIFFVATMNAQNSSVTIRFATPTFDCDSKVYCVDVEYTTDQSVDTLYGTNVRFFYNSADLTFKEFTGFATDYGLTNNTEVVMGAASSGANLFNFPQGEAATWINSGIQLKNQNGGIGMTQGVWTKYFSICFDAVGSPEALNDFCTELVWDLEQDTDNGGFFSGSDGVVITLKDGNQSKVADEVVSHMNWAYTGSGTAPYGNYLMMTDACVTNDCINCVVPNSPPKLKVND